VVEDLGYLFKVVDKAEDLLLLQLPFFDDLLGRRGGQLVDL
jgi:hypothetical protein